MNELKNIWKKLVDKDGWKKDAKKIALIVFAIAAATLAVSIYKMENWGINFQKPAEFVKYVSYEDQMIKFAFSDRYVLDKNEQKKFGSDYLAGFHLMDDSRTGCDVRQSEVGINFSKTDEEISRAVEADLAKSVKGLKNFDAKRIEIDEREAYRANFDLTDPLGNSLRINQVLVGNGKDNYLLVCGSGRAQAEFFQNDFEDFFKSFRLK